MTRILSKQIIERTLDNQTIDKRRESSRLFKYDLVGRKSPL